jgi:hypothetical protein
VKQPLRDLKRGDVFRTADGRLWWLYAHGQPPYGRSWASGVGREEDTFPLPRFHASAPRYTWWREGTGGSRLAPTTCRPRSSTPSPAASRERSTTTGATTAPPPPPPGPCLTPWHAPCPRASMAPVMLGPVQWGTGFGRGGYCPAAPRRRGPGGVAVPQTVDYSRAALVGPDDADALCDRLAVLWGQMTPQDRLGLAARLVFGDVAACLLRPRRGTLPPPPTAPGCPF